MSKATLAEQAYRTLKQALLENRFEPGQKLSIAGLKQEYDIGTSPLREALTRLVANGMLDCEQMKGFSVPTVSIEEVEDMYRARMLLELPMLRMSTEHMNDDEEAALVAALHHLRKIESHEMCATKFCVWQQKHDIFIKALMAGCHSPTLIRMQSQLYDRTERYRRIWFDWSSQQQHVMMSQHSRDHQLYVDALIARDAERLCDTYKAKLLRWLDEMRECLQDLQA